MICEKSCTDPCIKFKSPGGNFHQIAKAKIVGDISPWHRDNPNTETKAGQQVVLVTSSSNIAPWQLVGTFHVQEKDWGSSGKVNGRSAKEYSPI